MATATKEQVIKYLQDNKSKATDSGTMFQSVIDELNRMEKKTNSTTGIESETPVFSGGGKRRRRTNKRKGRKAKKSRKH